MTHLQAQTDNLGKYKRKTLMPSIIFTNYSLLYLQLSKVIKSLQLFISETDIAQDIERIGRYERNVTNVNHYLTFLVFTIISIYYTIFLLITVLQYFKVC